jgi:hypothetical protein
MSKQLKNKKKNRYNMNFIEQTYTEQNLGKNIIPDAAIDDDHNYCTLKMSYYAMSVFCTVVY